MTEEDRDEDENGLEGSAALEEARAMHLPRIPDAAALVQRSILDRERCLDHNHNHEEISVESHDEGTGTPMVWYKKRPPRRPLRTWHVRDPRRRLHPIAIVPQRN